MSTQEVGGRSINTWENVVQREREFHAGNQHHMEQLQIAMEHLRAGGSKGDSSSSSSSDGSNEPQSNEDRDSLRDLNHQTASALALHRSSPRPSIFEIAAPKSPNAGADSFQQNGLHNSFPNFAAAGAQQHFFAQTVMESTRQQDHIPFNSANNNINNSSQVHQHSSPSRTFFQSHDHQQLLPSQTMEMGNRHHQQVQETVFPMAISASPMRNYGSVDNYGAMNSSSNNNAYHLPTSNLPPEYRLDSSSKLHLPQMHQSYFQDNVNGYPTKYSQWPNWHLQTSMNDHSQAMASQQEIQFQELMNQPTGGSSFYPTGGSSSPTHFPNMQIQPGMNPYNVRSPSDHPHLESVMGNRLTMAMPDNSPSSTNLPSWLSQAQNPPASSPASNSRPTKSGIYDPIYEAMGLPVDPHLRMFLAKREDNDA